MAVEPHPESFQLLERNTRHIPILREEDIEQTDLMKLDCEGAEYAILPELARLGALQSIGWIRGEWHYRKQS